MQFFLNELQVTFKEFIETGAINGIPLYWRRLQSFTKQSLYDNYPKLYEKLDATIRSEKNQTLITLYKLEAFSSLFIHGNLDKQLAKEIIGYTFCKQIGFLLGIISYFRKNEKDTFGLNTIKLYDDWKTDDIS